MNRRGLLATIGGIMAGAATGVKPTDVAGALSKVGATGGAVGAGLSGATIGSTEITQEMRNLWNLSGKARTLIYNMQDAQREAVAWLPPDIAAKKSWSPAFKHSEAVRRIRYQQELRAKLDDDNVAAKVWEMLTEGNT